MTYQVEPGVQTMRRREIQTGRAQTKTTTEIWDTNLNKHRLDRAMVWVDWQIKIQVIRRRSTQILEIIETVALLEAVSRLVKTHQLPNKL